MSFPCHITNEKAAEHKKKIEYSVGWRAMRKGPRRRLSSVFSLSNLLGTFLLRHNDEFHRGRKITHYVGNFLTYFSWKEEETDKNVGS